MLDQGVDFLLEASLTKHAYTNLLLHTGNECWCGDSASEDSVTAASECSSPCTGDPTQICGGPWRLNVFRESASNVVIVSHFLPSNPSGGR